MIMLVALLCSVATLTAQNSATIALTGVVNGQIQAPATTLTVDVEVAHEVTLCGPYARYAQKFLGVRAPLTDKSEWRVTRAAIGLNEGPAYAVAPFEAQPAEQLRYADSEQEFAQLPVDKLSTVTLPLENAAEAAAAALFSLRHHRQELITGEAGEHVFGEGLKSALEEIARQEQAYLELFLGKQVTTYETKRFVVSPEASKKQYVVCRFSREQGLLPASDLTGNMVVLQITPQESVISPVAEAGVKDTSYVTAVVANRATCTLLAEGAEFAREVLPIFEFGRTIRVAVPRSR